MDERPLIAITMGDPAGVGPEIVAAAAGLGELHGVSRPLVIGDRGALERAAGTMGVRAHINPVTAPGEGRYEAGTVDLLDLGGVPADLVTGKVQGAAGRAAFGYIQRAAELALAGEVDAIATAPPY